MPENLFTMALSPLNTLTNYCYIIAMDETPYLIDPAVSYSHRECDIALSKLFGGFSNEFYLAYHNTFP